MQTPIYNHNFVPKFFPYMPLSILQTPTSDLFPCTLTFIWCFMSFSFLKGKEADVTTYKLLQVTVFWFVTMHSDIARYQHLRGPCCLHLQVAAWSSKTLVSCNVTTQCHNPEDCDLNLHFCENLKYYIQTILVE